MTNYFGRRRLTLILFGYLEKTAPEKLEEFKETLKAEKGYEEYIITYKKYRGSEWLRTAILYDGELYRLEIYAFGGGGKRVILREHKIIERDCDDITSEIFNGFAYYDKDFRPIVNTADKYSDLLVLQSIAKT